MSTQSDLTPQSDEGLEALRGVWASQGQTIANIDEVCDTGGKQCRNAVHMNFDGYAEEGQDVRDAWKDRLEKEGKVKGGSLRDLILGPREDG